MWHHHMIGSFKLLIGQIHLLTRTGTVTGFTVRFGGEDKSVGNNGGIKERDHTVYKL